MKKNLILGLILTSVLLMSVIGVSAQITGDAVITGDIAEGGRCEGGGTYHYNTGAEEWICLTGIDIKKDDSLRASSSSSVSADSARKSSSASSKRSSVLRGFTAVAAADPKVGTCYVKSSQSKSSRARFFGLVIRN